MLGGSAGPRHGLASIYLCLLRPVQRSGFIARVLGANLAGIHLEDGLGTPGKDNKMKGWVAAVLTQDLHSHQHLPPAQSVSGNPSAAAGSPQHLQVPQLQFCFALFRKEGRNRKHTSCGATSGCFSNTGIWHFWKPSKPKGKFFSSPFLSVET